MNPSDAHHAALQLEIERLRARIAELEARDIAARKLAEDALRESRASLDAALASMTDALFISDNQGRFTDFNEAFAAFHRFGSREECARTLAGYPDILEVFLPDGRLAPPEMWAAPRALGGEKIANAEYTLRRKDTGETWVGSYSFGPIRDKEGAIAGAVVVARDITELKAAGQALRLSEQRFRKIFENAPTGIAIADWTGRFQHANPAYCALLGYTEEELRATGFSSLVHPEDRAANLVRMQRLQAGELPYFEVENRYIRKDGQAVWVHKFVSVLQDAGGRPAHLVALVTDITERRRAERARSESEVRLKRAQEIAHLGSWELDLTENLLIWSDEVYRIFGLEPQEFGATYEAFLEAVHPEDRAAVDEAYSGSLREHRDAYEIEHRVVRKGTGEVRFVHERCQHFRDASGRIVRSLGMVHDITDRKRAEDRLRQAQKLESIGVLAGGIAHDFNNLLTSILGNASLLQLDAPAESAESLGAIVECGERAAALTRQLLAYAGNGRFQSAEFDVSRLVRSSAELLRASIPKNIGLELDVPAALPAVRGDASQFEQALMNLVINAAEAIGGREDGRVSIAADVRELDTASASVSGTPLAPGRYVRIAVRDNGCGMNQPTRARIFDPFFTTKFTGRGLGLAAVQGIVGSHKGAVIVESTPGAGSTFTVYLPCSEAVAGPGVRDAWRPDGRTGTVLVVDDEEPVRTFSKGALERLGYRVLLAVNGRQALETLASHDGVDLVLLDVVMPNGGGAEAFWEVRRRWPEMPVLVASGYNRDEARRLGIPDDAPFIEKPYTVSRLAAAVEGTMQPPSRGGA